MVVAQTFLSEPNPKRTQTRNPPITCYVGDTLLQGALARADLVVPAVRSDVVELLSRVVTWKPRR